MVKKLGLVMMVLGFCGIVGCSQAPTRSDPEVTRIPDSTLTYARLAVEVGTIQLDEMNDFETSVGRMDRGERESLWHQLIELHKDVHAKQVPDQENTACPSQDFQVPLGCSNARCSHSGPCGLAQWCCALGEDATFYM